MIRTLRIRRSSGPGDEPIFEEHTVDLDGDATVLDALETIRLDRDRTLAYRHSCHHSSCGTCACLIDGEERLTCVTRLADLPDRPVTVEPLRGFPVVADLAVDPTPLYADLDGTWAYLRASRQGDAPTAATERFEDCIECGACVSSCPVTHDGEPFVGPAALAALHRELDARPERRTELLELAAGERGVERCRRAINCSRRCPTGVSPARHIAMLRRQTERD